MEKMGIKETVEVLEFVDHVAVKAVEALKDGAQLVDLAAMLDPALWAKAQAAAADFKLIAAEVKDLDEEESLEVATRGIKIGFKVVKALKPVPVA